MARRAHTSLVFIVAACGAIACHRAEPPATTQAAPPGVVAPQAPGTAATSAREHPLPTQAVTDVAPPDGVLRAYSWHCDDGRSFVMRNLWRERAVSIPLHDGSHRLDQTRAASGTRYANAGESMIFWIKGGTATLEHKGDPTVHCEERREDSMREDARLGGGATLPPKDPANAG